MADVHAMEVEKLNARITWLEDELAARNAELAEMKENLARAVEAFHLP